MTKTLLKVQDMFQIFKRLKMRKEKLVRVLNLINSQRKRAG